MVQLIGLILYVQTAAKKRQGATPLKAFPEAGAPAQTSCRCRSRPMG